MQLLALSSSKVNNSDYLAPYLNWIDQHLSGCRRVLFIPFAGVSVDFDAYQARVAAALQPLSIELDSLHRFDNPAQAVEDAEAILVGGGNTFALLKRLQQLNLLGLIRKRVTEGLPYIGWSAGANLVGVSIRTTNDMPIVQPDSFEALGLLPFQLNPHYTDQHPADFHGETRDMRLAEFMELEPMMPIIALPEGSALLRQGEQLTVLGEPGAYQFKAGDKGHLTAGSDLSALLRNRP
ncbi:dipeptidase PepE [Alkalimonas sp.]|uniref:dipeptidase PepE n=1 Tax=Alkalimonas sp. TaxID=1872453 RepID=UPI00263B932B|nr:dipeptidase PepE [Alkalimonas sp.]MCC5825328.1 dipeptidase PepE [Alkalimonas sp.]